MGLHGLLRVHLYFLYVDDIRTSQETHIWASAACYGDSFTILVFPLKHGCGIYLSIFIIRVLLYNPCLQGGGMFA
jgi:hypothetical protein